jgi:hypothetical protein
MFSSTHFLNPDLFFKEIGQYSFIKNKINKGPHYFFMMQFGQEVLFFENESKSPYFNTKKLFYFQ